MSESEEPVLPVEAPPPVAIAAPATVIPAEWRPLPPAAATTAMYGGTGYGLLFGAGAAFFIGWPLLTKGAELAWWQSLAIMTVLWLLLGVLGAFIAYRRWLSSAWKLDETGLHFRRGRLWRKEILVPRSRVQHLDIERGPIERHYGLASLVVHTAGTRHHAMRIPGLPDEDAVALRDALVPAASRHEDVL